jgi:ADP-ribosylglycohydrolase
MSWAHAINNACLTVWGIYIGRNDIEKGITETVAMGYDNDCTAATVGSVLGAYLGISKLHQKWYKPWNDKVLSYLNGINEFSLDDIINRFFTLGKENL